MNAVTAKASAGTIVKSSVGKLGALKRYAFAHKLISAVVIIIVIGAGYFAFHALAGKGGETRYVLGAVAKGTIVSSVSESGQVSATDSVDIKPQVTGTITWVGVKAGDKVSAGQALMTIDDTDAEQSVTNAQQSLTEAKLQLQKDTAEAPVSYQNDVTAVSNAKEALQDDYTTAFNDLTNTYLDLPSLTATLKNTLYGYDFDPKKNQWNMDVLSNIASSQQGTQVVAQTQNMLGFKSSATTEYGSAEDEYTAALAAYQKLSRDSSNDDIDSLLAQSTTMLTDIAQALQTELNFLGAVSDLATTYDVNLPSSFTSVQSNTHTALSSANSDLSTLLAEKKTLDSAKQAIVSATQTVALDQVGNANGDNPISLQISTNSLAQQETDLAQQEADLADYTIRAPFSGTLSAVDLKVGDDASGDAATIISDSEIAQLSLNEVDAAKVAVGDKATLTFDAIDGLTLTGTVVEVDTTGTVSQGVVSYGLQIAFDTQDPRVKPGMTVTAEIETDVAEDVLVVPSSAVKTVNGASFVSVFTPALANASSTEGVTSAVPPTMVPVTTGLSDDTNVEITSGLTEGEQIVTRTVTASTAAASTASASSASRSLLGGGAVRAAVPVGGGGGAAFVRGG